jgi:hypothetical protein
MMLTPSIVALAYLAVSSLWTANDPFVGKWKLDIARSTYIDQFEVEAAGANRYAFTFEHAPTETIVADGTDQPGVFGTTLAVTIEDPHTWKILRKQAGHVVVSAIWKLSDDGQMLRDAFTGTQADGSTSTDHLLYRRTAGKAGVVGVWETTDVKLTPEQAYHLQIQPYGDHGLSFATSVKGAPVKNVTFDGQDHPSAGADGATSSGRRGGERDMEVTNKAASQFVDRREFRVSGDGKTLTMTLHPAHQKTPSVFVFDRE